jgi:hypothetical protein
MSTEYDVFYAVNSLLFAFFLLFAIEMPARATLF